MLNKHPEKKKMKNLNKEVKPNNYEEN